jgi:hypothetical protein
MTETLFVLSQRSVSVRLPGLRPKGFGREKEGGSRDSAQEPEDEEDRWSRTEFSVRDLPRPLARSLSDTQRL